MGSCCRLSSYLFTNIHVWIVLCFFVIPVSAQTQNDSIVIQQQSTDASRGQVGQADFEEQRDNLAIISFSGDYDRSLPNNEFNLDARAAIARSFYTQFADKFDFLVVFTTFEFDSGDALAFFHPVRNSIQGIGRNIFDNGFLYDSPKTLQGYVDMAAYTRYVLDSTAPGYRNVLSTLSHEVMHRWFSGIQYIDDSGNVSTDLLGLDGDHWPVFSDSQASVMGGAIWRDNEDGTHTALDSFRGYSDFDLYLAGFLPPDTGLSHVLIRANGDTERLFPSLNETISGEREAITLDQLIAANGPRIPGYDQTQRNFQLGFVLLKRPGENIPESLVQAIAGVQKDFSQRFSAQTGGVGIALTHLTETGSGVISVPDTVIDASGQTSVFDADRATDWLIAQQTGEGYWQDKAATRVRDTALAARYIRNSRPSSNAWSGGRDWLISLMPVSSDDRVWQIASTLLPGDLSNQLIGGLRDQQLSDGGWGLQGRFQSSPLDTALIALTMGGTLPDAARQQAIAYLFSRQNGNGNWSPVEGGTSELLTTAYAISALALQSNNAQALDAGVQWLRDQQRVDGGYGDNNSTVSSTVAVLRALTSLLPSSDPSIQNAIGFLSNRQHVDGHWEFSVHSTAQAADFLSSQGRPNLLWQSISTQPSPAVTGQPVQVNGVVTNNGVIDAPPSTAVLVDVTSGVDEIVAGPLPVDTLAAGNSREVSFLFDTSGLTGERLLQLRLDPDLLIDEVNELDNESAVPLDILPSLAGVDAAIFSAELDLAPGSINSLPASVQISINVRNLGDQTANNLVLALLDNRTDGVVELQRTMLELPPAGAELVTFMLDLQSRPLNSFSIVVDPDAVLSEVNENNNQIEFDVPFTDGVDLFIATADIIINPQPAVTGSDNILQVSFRNIGTSDAPPATAQVLERFDGQTRVLLDTITQLPAGGSDTRVITWRPLQTGDHQIEVLLDQDNAIAESDEDNNTASIIIAAGAASLANLIIDTWEATPDPALEGASVQLQASIRNGGAAINTDIEYSVYSGDPQQGGALLESGQIVNGLGSGTTASINFTTESLAGSTNRIFILQLDPADLIMESDESDNQTFIEVMVRSLPDLLVTPAAVSLTPTSPVPGQTVTATINISNLGQQPSGSFEVKVEEAESIGDFSLAAPPASVTDIPEDSSAASQIAWIWPADKTITRLRVTVDSGATVLESDESNNMVTRAVSTQSGELFLTELFISPDGNGVKDTTTIAFSLDNPDSPSIQIVDPAGEVVRVFGPFMQATQGSAVWDGRDDNNRVLDDEEYSVRLIGSTGIRALSKVTVDTNRYPLYRAIGTPREHISLLSCEIGSQFNSQKRFSIDGERLLISDPEDALTGDDLEGIYSIPTLGRGLQTVVSQQWLDDLANQEGFNQRISEFYVLANGNTLFVSSGTSCNSQCSQKIWVTGGSGGAPVMLNYTSLRSTSIVDVIDESQVLVFSTDSSNPSPRSDGQYYLVGLNGINPAQMVNGPTGITSPSGSSLSLEYIGRTSHGFLLTDSFDSDPDESNIIRVWLVPFDPAQDFTELAFLTGELPEHFALSGNGRYFSVLVTADGAGSEGARMLIYDFEVGVPQPISIDVSSHGDANELSVQWSPVESRLYLVHRMDRRIVQYDSSGNLLQIYNAPDISVFNEIVSQFNSTAVSPGGIAIQQPGASCPGAAKYELAVNGGIRPPKYNTYNDFNGASPLVFSPDGSRAILNISAIDEAPIEGCLDVRLANAPFMMQSNSPMLTYLPELRTDFYTPCQANDQHCQSGVNLPQDNVNSNAWLLPTDGIASDIADKRFVSEITPSTTNAVLDGFSITDIHPRQPGLAATQFMYRGIVPVELEECGSLPGSSDWSSRSMDNIIAHLESEFENGLFTLHGIAADRHLDHYLLEWSSVETPNQRNALLAPQAMEVHNDVMAFWSPPQAGIFNIYLTVVDKAGNRSMDVVSVSSSEPASISSISGMPGFISPNGDGIQDEYSIQFRVFQPLAVNIVIADSSGMTVSTISQDIISPSGELMTVVWDGLDNAGIPVADGVYTVKVNNRPLFVTVDTTPPDIDFLTINNDYVRISSDGLLGSTSTLRTVFSETNPDVLRFEIQFEGSDDWELIDEIQSPCESGLTSCDSDSAEFPLELFSGNRFRMLVSDLAGNQTSQAAVLTTPELVLLGSGHLVAPGSSDNPFDLLQSVYLPDQSDVAFFDAPTAPVTGMYAISNISLLQNTISLEFSNGDDDWFELPVDQQDQASQEAGLWGFQHPSGDDSFWTVHHVLLWGSVNYPQFISYSVRLRAITNNGEELISNVVELGNILNAGIVDKDSPVRDWARDLLSQALVTLPPKPQDTMRLWLSGLSDQQPADNIQLSVTSNTDPRYLSPVNIAPVAVKRTIDIERHRFVAVFEVPIECLLDYAGDFSTRVRLFTGDIVALGQKQSFSDSCGLSVQAGPDFATACGAPAINRVIVDTLFMPNDSTRLDAIIIERDLPNGAGEVLISDTTPALGANRYELDTSLLPVGQHGLLITAVLDNGEVLTETSSFLVQDEVPSFDISFPQAGERICVNSGFIDFESDELALPVVGFIEGSQPYTYRLSLKPAGIDSLFGVLAYDGGPGANGAAMSGIKLTSDADCDPVTDSNCRLQVNSAGLLQGDLGVLRRDLDNLPATGQFQAIMTATNWGGALACVGHPFELDSAVNAGAAMSSRDVISPNADGAFDNTIIQIFANEPLFISGQLFNAQRVGNGSFVPIGSALENLFDALPASGDFQYTWDGIGSQGAYADGDYIVQLTLQDDCGFLRIDNVHIVVDNTGPEVNIDFPRVDSELSTVIEVLGTVSDLHFDRYRLAFREAGSNGTGATLATGEQEVINNFLGFWNLSGLLDSYELLLTAVDEVNNTSETSVTIDINELGSLIFAFDAQPRRFSPDGDGVLDGTVATLGLLTNADINISVTASQGNSIRQLMSSNLDTGSHQVVWNGLNNNGSVVADGQYDISVMASSAGQFQEEMVSVVVDNTPPFIQLLNPQGAFSNGTGALSVQFDDLNFESYTIYRSPQAGMPASQLVVQGDMVGTVDALNLSALGEGVYSVRALAFDQAGNESLLEHTFTIDRTLPQVDLLSPVDGSFLSMQDGPAPIQGQFSDQHFSAYSIDIRASGTTDSWQNLFTGNTQPNSGLLFEWDLGVPDGAYELRLLVTDLAGNTRMDVVTTTVDNSVPQLALTAPSDGAVIGPNTQVIGQASDTNLRRYRVSLSPAISNPPLWSDFIVGAQSVTDGVLGTFGTLPADGDYLLRLMAEDLANNSVAIIQAVTVDSTAPSTPQNLSAQVQGGVVDLNWNAVSDVDLAGYRLFRDGAVISMGGINGTSFTDTGAADGEHTYHVAAVDAVGNQSPLSNPAVVQIDTTPPTAILLAPASGSRHAGDVAVRASAFGDDDLANYQLYLAADGQSLPGDLLTQSGVPVNAAVIFSLDTTTLISESVFTLTLIAEDLTGNQAQTSVQITVDNTPPVTPVGLQASVDQDTASLSWTPNSESDLLGYVLLRNGELVNGPALSDDLRPLALPDSNFVDAGLPDGEHIYTVLAIDTAGNVSAPSAAVSVIVELGPPDLQLVQPANGMQFDGPLLIVADSDALDIAEVIFEYRPAAGGVWVMIGNADTLAPFEATLDPTGLERGFYQLRGLATDQGGLSDPSPPVVNVEHRDLNPPPPVTQVSAQVTGSDVVLNWDAVSADDLAGYHIDRMQSETTVRITSSALATTTFTDTGLVDGMYSYQVIAVDDNDNESTPSTAVVVQVVTPRLDATTPLVTDTSIVLTGFSDVQGNAILTVTPSGYTDTQSVMNDGAFSFDNVPLNVGDNLLQVVINYAGGNVSNTGSAMITQAQPPSAPTGLVADVSDQQITLNWNPNPEPDIAGYQVYLDTSPLIQPSLINGLVADASVENASADNSVDGNFSSFWQISGDSLLDGTSQSIRYSFPQPEIVNDITLQWQRFSFETAFPPQRFQIQALFNGAWQTMVEQDSDGLGWHMVRLDQPIRTDQMRVVIFGPPQNFNTVRLYEAAINRVGLTDTTTHDVGPLPNGTYEFTVTAINDIGLESDNSDPATAVVGDFTAPSPVILEAQVTGNDVQLSWNASQASDLSHYQLYRDGEQIAIVIPPETLFMDTNLAGGEYSYAMTVVDLTGNESEFSNTVSVVIQADAPEPPSNLTVLAPTSGDVLELSWTASPSANVVRYVVSRALQTGGPYTFQAIVDAPNTSYQDTTVIPGQTYYYVVQAADTPGNLSAFSNEASATPIDSATPQPPVINTPTSSGNPIEVATPAVDIAGTAEPGVRVTLEKNNQLLGTMQTSADYSVIETTLATFVENEGGLMSPDGRWLFMRDFPSDHLINLEGGQGIDLPTEFGIAQWSSDAKTLFLLTDDRSEVLGFDIAKQQVATLYSDVEINAFAVSPDQTQLFVAGIHNTGTGMFEGLWISELDTGAATLFPDLERFFVNRNTVRWSPNAEYIGFTYVEFGNELYIINTLGELQTRLPLGGGSGSIPEWRPGGDGVMFISRNDMFRRQIVFLPEPFTTALPETLSVESDADHTSPSWSPDGNALVWQRSDFIGEDESVQIIEVFDFPQREITLSVTTEQFQFLALRWLSNGTIRGLDTSKLLDVLPPGGFFFAQAMLDIGSNEFVAFAVDDAGNQSFDSEPISVAYLPQNLPDLVLESISVLPASANPGQNIDINLSIANQGSVDAGGLFGIRLVDSFNNTISQLSTTSLGNVPDGGLLSGGVTLAAPAVSGAYRVIVTADPDSQIIELDESNNTAVADLSVVDNGPPTLMLILNQNTLVSGEMLTGIANVFNPSSTLDARLQLQITDSANEPIANLPEIEINDLFFGESRMLSFDWDSMQTFAGDYQLRALLLDTAGELFAEQLVPFTLIDDAQFQLELSTDQAQYETGATVLMISGIDYAQGTTPVDGAQLRLQAFDDSNGEVFTRVITLGRLLPQDQVVINENWQLDGIPAGHYLIQSGLFSDGAEAATAQTAITVIPASTTQTLTGTVTLATPNVAHGNPIQANYDIINTGDVTVQGDLIIELAAAGQSSVVDQQSVPLDLDPGAMLAGNLDFATSSLTPGTYSVLLRVNIPTGTSLLDVANLTLIDADAPSINILAPAQDAVTGSSVLFRVSANDSLTTIDSVRISVDDGLPRNMALGVNGEYSSNFDLPDGNHLFTVTATDGASNSASADGGFVVDSISPAISISGVDDGLLTNQPPVIPVITIVDEHLQSSSILLNNQSFVSATPITTDNDYVLFVSAVDEAGNSNSVARTFTIDTQGPEIVLISPPAGSVVMTPVVSIEILSEANVLASLQSDTGDTFEQTTDATGSAVFTAVPLSTGNNNITIQGVDPAGNTGAINSFILTLDADPVAALNGSISIADIDPAIPRPMRVNYVVINTGNVAFTDLPVRVLLKNDTTQSIESVYAILTPLAVDSAISESLLFTTEGLEAGDYTIVLEADLETGIPSELGTIQFNLPMDDSLIFMDGFEDQVALTKSPVQINTAMDSVATVAGIPDTTCINGSHADSRAVSDFKKIKDLTSLSAVYSEALTWLSGGCL